MGGSEQLDGAISGDGSLRAGTYSYPYAKPSYFNFADNPRRHYIGHYYDTHNRAGNTAAGTATAYR